MKIKFSKSKFLEEVAKARELGLCYNYLCKYCSEPIRLSYEYKTCPNCGASVPICQMAKRRRK